MLEKERKKIIKAAYLHDYKTGPAFRCTQPFRFVPSHLGLPPRVCNYSDGLPLCSLRRCGRSSPPCAGRAPQGHGVAGATSTCWATAAQAKHGCPPGTGASVHATKSGTEPSIIHVIWIVPSGSVELHGNASWLRPPLRAALRPLVMQLPPCIILPACLLGVFISNSYAETTGWDQGINFLASKGYKKHRSRCLFTLQEVKALVGTPWEAREGLLW